MSEVDLDPFWPGLNFPTSVALDGCDLIVAECGLPLGGAPAGGRVLRRRSGARVTALASDLTPPLNGALPGHHSIVVSVGGHPARLARLNGSGRLETLVEGFAGPGNYHVNAAVRGPDGDLYFAVGAMTNTGVIGPDGLNLAWLRRLRHAGDVPALALRLSGQNFCVEDPDSGKVVRTGAFSPFGSATTRGQLVPPGMPATAAILRCRPDGRELEVVAWGVRNAYGLGFLADGRLLAVDQGADDRGVRPVANVPDFLFEIKPGAWYGWPDFMGGRPITDPLFAPTRGPAPDFLLENHDELPLPEKPLLRFPAHAAATKFAQIPETAPRFGGHLLVTLFGDERPMTAPAGPPVGRCIVRVDPADWSLHNVPLNGIRRPIDIAIEEATDSVYIADFGDFEMGPGGSVAARAGSGRVWRAGLGALIDAMT